MHDSSAIAILNYHSGRDDKRRITRLLTDVAREMGVRCDFVLAKSPRHVDRAARKAAAGPYETVIAGGGDGTINAVASYLVGAKKRLGVLPLGTFNYFARELLLPLDLTEAFRACFDGETRPATVGAVNGRIFLNNASVGLYPLILSKREATYRKWGRRRFGAYWSVVQTLLRRGTNLDLTLTADGCTRTVRTPLLFVARNSYQLDEFNVPGMRCIMADGFSVFVVKPMDRPHLVRLAVRALARRLQPSIDFETFCTTRLTVESPRIGRTLAFDGERVLMTAPLEFLVLKDALQVAVPAVLKTESAA
jgi:diacylglycerol kinase family enzyme